MTQSRRSGGLGNVYSPALGHLWSATASTFNDQTLTAHACLREGHVHYGTHFIESSDFITKSLRAFKILNPPTGSGKTTGLALYSALICKANRELLNNPERSPTGILAIVRLKAQAESLAAMVNQLAGYPGRELLAFGPLPRR